MEGSSIPRLLSCFGVLMLLLLHVATAAGEEQCAPDVSRGLVLSGGGAKGAFEAGAVFHLVVHRGCDFRDMSGVSVGALNAAYLAQAPSGSSSLQSLQAQSKGLVELWRGIRGPKDVLRERWLGLIRLALFGLESLNDFSPLRALIEREIDPDQLLRSGRRLRVGVGSFYDGAYREVEPNSPFLLSPAQFRDYVFASALIPVYGGMPRLQETKDESDSHNWPQFGDGGLRHTTPIVGYFQPCDFKGILIASFRALPSDGASCLNHPDIPAHEDLQEVIIVLANPYKAHDDRIPPPKCCPVTGARKHVSDGREVLSRTLGMVLDSPYRWDVNFARAANRMLEWRERLYRVAEMTLDPATFERFKREADALDVDFPVRSSNRRPDGLEVAYRLGVVIPEEVYADTYGFDPDNIKLQLRKGCEAAEITMVKDLQLSPMPGVCQTDFPMPSSAAEAGNR